MKLIEKWEDAFYDSKNSLYEFENGFRLLICVKDIIKNFNADLIIQAGSYFETQLSLPGGTAHFLEHMILNPNKKFNTKEDINKFKFGNRETPEIFTNASTWVRLVDYYGSTKMKGSLKLLQFLKYLIDYPEKRFEEFIEIERNIILAELLQKKPEDKDSSVAYDKFFLEEHYPEFAKRIIGTEASIKEITVEHLKSYWAKIKNPENAILAIHSNKFPSKSELNEIKKIALHKSWAKSKSSFKIKRDLIPNQFKYKHFNDDQSQDIFMSLNFIKETEVKVDYKYIVLRYMAVHLLYYVSINYLREDLGLIYSFETFNQNDVWNNAFYGFSLSFSKEKFEKTLDELHKTLFKKVAEFVKTDVAKEWFESKVSNYIFSSPNFYDENYASNTAMNILNKEYYYKYDGHKSINMAKKVKLSMLLPFIKKHYLSKDAGFWFVSPYEDKEIYSIFKKSKFYKHYKK